VAAPQEGSSYRYIVLIRPKVVDVVGVANGMLMKSSIYSGSESPTQSWSAMMWNVLTVNGGGGGERRKQGEGVDRPHGVPP
jgi:hypothetical protein